MGQFLHKIANTSKVTKGRYSDSSRFRGMNSNIDPRILPG